MMFSTGLNTDLVVLFTCSFHTCSASWCDVFVNEAALNAVRVTCSLRLMRFILKFSCDHW